MHVGQQHFTINRDLSEINHCCIPTVVQFSFREIIRYFVQALAFCTYLQQARSALELCNCYRGRCRHIVHVLLQLLCTRSVAEGSANINTKMGMVAVVAQTQASAQRPPCPFWYYVCWTLWRSNQDRQLGRRSGAPSPSEAILLLTHPSNSSPRHRTISQHL